MKDPTGQRQHCKKASKQSTSTTTHNIALATLADVPGHRDVEDKADGEEVDHPVHHVGNREVNKSNLNVSFKDMQFPTKLTYPNKLGYLKSDTEPGKEKDKKAEDKFSRRALVNHSVRTNWY